MELSVISRVLLHLIDLIDHARIHGPSDECSRTESPHCRDNLNNASNVSKEVQDGGHFSLVDPVELVNSEVDGDVGLFSLGLGLVDLFIVVKLSTLFYEVKLITEVVYTLKDFEYRILQPDLAIHEEHVLLVRVVWIHCEDGLCVCE